MPKIGEALLELAVVPALGWPSKLVHGRDGVCSIEDNSAGATCPRRASVEEPVLRSRPDDRGHAGIPHRTTGGSARIWDMEFELGRCRLVNATVNYRVTWDKIKLDSGVGSARLCGWCPTPGFAMTVM